MRPDLHSARYSVSNGIEPDELAFVAGGVFDREKHLVAAGRGHEAMRLRPDFDAFDDLVRRRVDNVDVVAERVGDIELLNWSILTRRSDQTLDELVWIDWPGGYIYLLAFTLDSSRRVPSAVLFTQNARQ